MLLSHAMQVMVAIGNEVKKGLEFVIIRYLISGQLESGTYSAGQDPVRQRFKRRRRVRSESSN